MGLFYEFIQYIHITNFNFENSQKFIVLKKYLKVKHVQK